MDNDVGERRCGGGGTGNTDDAGAGEKATG